MGATIRPLGVFTSPLHSLVLELCGWPTVMSFATGSVNSSDMEFFDWIASRGQVEQAAAMCVFHVQFIKAIQLLVNEAKQLQISFYVI